MPLQFQARQPAITWSARGDVRGARVRAQYFPQLRENDGVHACFQRSAGDDRGGGLTRAYARGRAGAVGGTIHICRRQEAYHVRSDATGRIAKKEIAM
jgi:hypothetical protein